MEHKLTYYQPEWYHDDGTNIEYGGTPDELASFMVFQTREICEEWLENNDYDPGDFAIIEYHDDEIEDPTFIDADGYYEDGTCSVGAYNTEKDLDEGYDKLYEAVSEALERTGRHNIEISPVTLYEDNATLNSLPGNHTDWPEERPTITSIDRVCAYTDRGEGVPLENITDYDDYMMLVDAVVLVK